MQHILTTCGRCSNAFPTRLTLLVLVCFHVIFIPFTLVAFMHMLYLGHKDINFLLVKSCWVHNGLPATLSPAMHKQIGCKKQVGVKFKFPFPSAIYCKPTGDAPRAVCTSTSLYVLSVALHTLPMLGFVIMEKWRFCLTWSLFVLKPQLNLTWGFTILCKFTEKGHHPWGFGDNDYCLHLLSAHTSGLYPAVYSCSLHHLPFLPAVCLTCTCCVQYFFRLFR